MAVTDDYHTTSGSNSVFKEARVRPRRSWIVITICKGGLYSCCFYEHIISLPFSSVQSLSLCDPMNRSTPGIPVHHQLPEFIQTHIHWVGDTIQPSHPLSSPSPPAPNPSQHQSLFQWVNSSHEVGQSTGFSALASFLPKKSQGWSPSEWTGWISL